MLPMLALGALQLGGSLLAGKGQADASAKQARLQMIADAQAREANEKTLSMVNARREELGREMLTIPEESGGWVDVDSMNAAAERAGINPYAFMMAGGLSAYTQNWRTGHNAEAAYKLMAPEYSLTNASQVPQQHSMLTALGNGIVSAGNAMATQYRADQSYDLQMSKMLLSSDMMSMGMSSQNGYQTAITYGGTGGRIMGAVSASGAGALSMVGAGSPSGKKGDDAFWPGYESAPAPLWEAKKPEVTNPFNAGMGLDWKIPPGFADAQAYEDAGAEVWSWPYAVWKGANTVLYNTYGKTIPEVYRAAKDEVAAWKAPGKAHATGPVEPYVPAGMPRSIAYPNWVTP